MRFDSSGDVHLKVNFAVFHVSFVCDADIKDIKMSRTKIEYGNKRLFFLEG